MTFKTLKESKLIPLEHLEDTPPELRKEIDGLIAKMIDLDGPGYQFNRCSRRLREIGRPAIPRLLNKMYETPAKVREDVLVLARIVGALRDTSGVAFGFNPADRKDSDIGGTEEERLSALRQWYAWWYTAHNRDFTRAIDKSEGEDLFETDAEKAARATAEAEARQAAEAAAKKQKK